MTAVAPQYSPAQDAVDPRTLRVLVVEDHELMREALERRLSQADGFEMIAGVDSVAKAVDAFTREQPDLVLVDHSLPDGYGMDVLGAVRELDPAAIVVMLSGHDDPALIASYLAAGASGYAHKTVGGSEMLRVLRAAVAGLPALDPVATQRVLQRLHEPEEVEPEDASPLSRRETEVLALVAAGHTNEDIASRLYISPQTVKTHLSRIFGKLNVRDRASAAAKAIREGMLD